MNQQIETRFVELMTELFQLDEAEALDFGLYRVIRRHNREVKAFLGEIVTAQETKLLRDGKLATILDKAFALQDNETKAEDKFRLKDLEQQLGLKPGMTKEQREAALAQAEGFPALKDLVAEYRSRTETLVTQQTVQQDRAEVLNRLYQFFSRHYQDGDFIVERRYSKGGARYIKSTGEDTEFHWATEDMYYIKSGDIFTDWPVRLSNGQRVTFTVEPESLQNTRAALKPSDKAHYELDEATKDGDSIKVSLKYLKGAQTEKQKDEIVAAVQTKVGGDSADIKRWLNRFIARNQSDFFIHKRLKEALTEDLDIFIKTEVLTIDQLLAGGDLPKRAMKVARIMREVGGHIIDFLAALEDFQKALWEKKKLVFETRYVITLDRLERYCPKWLIQNVDTIVEKQRREWQELGLGEYSDSTGCIRKSGGDLVTPAAEHYLPLPVDTRNFDADFKWSMLAAVTAETALDDVLDGLAIHSDNWQALKTLQEKYRERVKCIYIDPPYNTGGDGFPYKDAYPHSSWMAMIVNRLQAGVPFMHPIGALFASIDANERRSLEIALDISLGRKNRVEEIIWAQNTTKNQSPTYSNNHEYVEVYARSLDAVKRDERMFREPKPGASEILDLVEKLNPKFPSVAQIEREIAALFSRHREEFRAELEDLGIEYDKSLDPWKRLYNYTHAEYRDECGRYVSEAEASTKQARIWVWREDNPSMPNVSAGSQKESVRDPKDPNYRFYRPEHPVSHEPCPAPKRGWVWPEKPLTGFSGSFSELAADNRIVWGDRNPKRPKVPQVKKFLHEMDTQVSKSVVLDYTDGEKELTHLRKL
jgi:adenine-specific DNA-methyltransferase